MSRPRSALILAALLGLAAQGCGFKGPLVLEQPGKKAPAATPAPPPAPPPGPEPGSATP